jgi:archaellin
MQDLIYDDEFISALGEQEAVTIQVTPNFGSDNG